MIGFGPLEENEAMKGISPSFTSSLLNIVAVAFLVIGRTIDEKRLNLISLDFTLFIITYILHL